MGWIADVGTGIKNSISFLDDLFGTEPAPAPAPAPAQQNNTVLYVVIGAAVVIIGFLFLNKK